MAKTIRCTFCNKNRDESHKMIISGVNAICDNCVQLFGHHLNLTFENSTTISKPKKTLISQLNSIKIRQFLDEFAIGQDAAKMALCVSVVNHYKRMLFNTDEFGEINKSNLLITGPSGSGKSLLVSTIAKFLDVPFVSVDATTLTEAGYIGQNVDSIMQRLVISANGDLNKAENGIVFIDEIDKTATNNNRAGSDTKTSGVQAALLKMIEGTIVPVNLSSDPKRPSPRTVEINTKNILFVCAGSFTKLNDIVIERLKKKKNIGFSNNNGTSKQSVESEYTTEDFIEFGMIPEFIGRFPIKTYTTELSEKELTQVLANEKNNILNEYRFYFGVDQIDLAFSSDFISNVARRAKKEKTGVRGLRAICDQLMLPHLYLLPEYQKRGVAKMTFTSDCLDQKQIPKIEIYEKKEIKKVAIK